MEEGTKEVVVTGEKPSRYTIGGFKMDVKANTMTLLPGTYVFVHPVVFTIHEDTKIEGGSYTGLLNGDSNGKQ